jgi:hypothetical protein
MRLRGMVWIGLMLFAASVSASVNEGTGEAVELVTQWFDWLMGWFDHSVS